MTILSKRRIVKLKARMKKQFAMLLAIIMFIEVSWPTQLWALTGGPSQPEVQSFEPIGTSDMVDLFTGDFNYNLPLLDVEGYPVNISYHSGITTDQEASWVGLGWNINPGVINRNMRGLPDDFAGENVIKQFNMKPNKTWGVAANVGIELFGNESIGLNLGGSYGFNFNNYTGPSVIKSFNVNISAGLGGAGKLNAGLGLTSSSDEGLTVQPSLGFSAKIDNGNFTETSLGVSVGTAFNSRGGLKQLSINASASVSRVATDKTAVTNKDGSTSYVETKSENKLSGSLGNIGAGGTFDFGQATYTPKIDMPMKNFSMSGSFTLGGELWGVHGKIGLSGFYSAQELAQTTISNPAYGYLYAEQGTFNDNALLDFNREKDGAITENTPALPLTNFTFDTYGVSGQGVGGSYRPFRGDIGYIFDAQSYTTNDNAALTVELGFGGYVHVGTNVTVIDVQSVSGKWKSNNAAAYTMLHTAKGDGNDFENVYFKEANEKTVDSDTTFYESAGRDNPVRFDASFSKFNHNLNNAFVTSSGQTLSFGGPIKRKSRDKKTQNISFLKRSEYAAFALENLPFTSTATKPHHIAEVTTLGVDGARYVYGIAAYNNEQKELTFSVGSTQIPTHDNDAALGSVHNLGLVSYSSGSDNTLNNSKGLDNYFSSTETPGYAHSFLLTAVLPPDYIDADGVRGPSDGDFGGYTKFRYSRIADYKWRTPIEKDMATYTEGLKSDFQDDKANIIYGSKDVWFLDTIITKNYIAVFHKSSRTDAVGVNDENGGISAGKHMLRLDSISLYSKRDLTTPLKRVHFEYSYALCPGIPNSSTSQGKLTLKKIFFTYQNSNRARMSPYVFDYHESNPVENPPYNVKAYDRWGNYKLNNPTTLGVRMSTPHDATSFIGTAILPASDYPYVEQDTTITNKTVSVWTLKEINLPSGGTIKVSYESDDYAYVQNRQAGQMFKIINFTTNTSTLTATNIDQSHNAVSFDNPNGMFIFKPHAGDLNPAHYINNVPYVYFRMLTVIRDKFNSSKDHIEYVSGYGEMQNVGFFKVGGVDYGYLQMKDVNLKDDNTGAWVNPVVRTGINYGKLHLPKVVWDATGGSFSGTLSGSIVSAMINSSFIKNVRDAVVGPTQTLFANYNVARKFVPGKSWVRLNNPNGHKLGGGLRVRKIQMIDNWQVMVGTPNGETSDYGQEYNYNLADGTSSGVASYEPQLGGDENSMKQPIFVSTKKLMVPDDHSYVEEPFGESFFPSPSVGYSQVTVTNLKRSNVTRHATGKVVHEFYTAKDFPTITKRTNIKFKRGKDSPGSLNSLLKINVRDYFAATQGFVVELNDMHGKPKGQKVYQENQSVPITSIDYKYKCDPYLSGSFKLKNGCRVVSKDGKVSTRNIGQFFDMVGDFRESKTETNSTTIALNVDVIPVFGVPALIPGIWPGFAKDKTRVRTAGITKVVQRFGILDETIAKDLGSVVSTKNLAYDAETGTLLLTQTTTNYNDKIYTFKYPAWWYYENMGASYTNLGIEKNGPFTISGGNLSLGSFASLFKEGDEVALSGSIPIIAWVNSVGGGNLMLLQKNGAPVSGTYTNIKVLRSGKRNNLTTDMATITTLADPLPSLMSNTYQNVLQASAVEFSNKRKTHCNCIANNSSVPLTTNPFVAGTKGTWRPLKSYTHLTTRSQTRKNGNTNIRKDGVFESYTPFYKLAAGNWQIDAKNWTHVSEVTEFNVFGQEVENQDALGRFSSATFGYNQTMALSVAANAMFKEQGFDGFEDYAFNPCVDDHFKFSVPDTVKSEAHTGRYSVKVSSGTPVYLTRQIALNCVDNSGCKIALSVNYDAIQKANLVSVTNGVGPFNISWNVLSGASSNPQFTITSSGGKITSSGPYTLEITITDSKGCTQTITVTGS